MDDAAAEAHLEAGRMTIWEHLGELRTRVIRSVVSLVVAIVVAFFVYPYLLDWLKVPYGNLIGQTNPMFYNIDPLEPFATRIKISAYLSIVFAMPVLLWQIWRFVTPGLYPHEKKYAVPFVVSSMVLFAFGAAVAYYTLNATLVFLQEMGGGNVTPTYTIDNYVTLIAYMMLAFGIGFEFPVLLVALQVAGVLSPQRLLSWWRTAIVVITIVAAVITPSGDPISMMALAVPMYIFYALSVVIGYIYNWRKRKRKEKKRARSKRSTDSSDVTSDT